MTQTISQEILTKLANRTVSFFNEDLSLKMDNNFSIEEVELVNYLDITTLISLSSNMTGTIGMSVSKKLSEIMAKGFLFGEPTQEEIDELSGECVSETLNVTLGNIIKDLDIVKNGGSVNISTPYTMHNSVTITKKKNGIMFLCRLKLDDESILLTYFK
jgi:CheY-specific phosphatase CheX